MKSYHKKYKKIATLLLLALTVGTTFSCKKALENELSNNTYADTFWKKSSDVESATLGAYGLLRKSLNQNSCFFIWGDVPVGTFGSDEGSLATDLATVGSFTVPYWNEGAHNWTNWFRVVDASNLIIENVNRMPQNVLSAGQRSQYLGEAYFLRAISYFYMTRVWGDVPLQLTATTSADQAVKMGRTAAVTIIKQVMEDAAKASSLLTWESASTFQKTRGSKGGALALLAHASAWAKQYDKTVLYTDSIISRQDIYGLQPQGSLTEIFENSGARENIFAITAKNANNEAAAFTNYQFTANVAFLTVSAEQVPGMPYNPAYYYVPVEKAQTLYDDEPGLVRKFENLPDLRLTEFFYRSSQDGTLKDKLSLRKYANIAFKNAASTSNPLAESNLVIFRLADMILLKAEALRGLGREPEARDAVNLIRSRVGVKLLDQTSAGTALRRDIVLERERELIGEGHSYFDVVRNAVNANDNTFFAQIFPWAVDKDRYAQKGYYWPIDNAILNSNRLISQNEFWMGKL